MRKELVLGFILLVSCSGETSICKGIEGTYCSLDCEAVTVSCSWGGVSATEVDCESGCIARTELLAKLCDAGVEEDIEVVESEMVCEVEPTTSI